MSDQLGRYQWLLKLAAPLLLRWANKQDPARAAERKAIYNGALPERPIWLHAASFGEAKAAGTLIEAIREQGYDGAWLVTTTTQTGGEAIQSFLRDGDRHLYAPVDLKSVVERALDQIKPRLLIVMEVEIWPNLWAACQQREVPVVLANARLSESSLKTYLRYLPRLWRSTLNRAAQILAQSDAIADRYRQLGVADNKLQVVGNLKYSQPVPDDIDALGQRLRQQLGTERPVWLAASTHDSEEQIALDCHRELLRSHPDLLLVIVPRHPQRFNTVAQLCQQSGLNSQRRSSAQAQPVDAQTQVYLADTLGELLSFYAAADLCWVAGSFVDVGGHNILEPAGCDCPVVVGPDMRNFEEITQIYLAHKALVQVATEVELAQAIEQLMAQPQRREQLSASARQLCLEQSGSAMLQAEQIGQQLNG